MALRKILRTHEVLDLTGLKRATMYRRIAAGTFPEPIRLGPRSIGFYADEIEEWQAACARGTDSARGRRLRRARRSAA
jgi:prophage regulatory protein